MFCIWQYHPRGEKFVLDGMFKIYFVSSDLDKAIFCICIGLAPKDSFDEAVADMITDSVTDIKNAVIKAHFEKDEAKKVLS